MSETRTERRPHTPAVVLKTADEIAIMREAGRILAQAHAAMREAVRPGISTAALDRIAEATLRQHGAAPVFKHYQPHPSVPPFPGTITASLNHELVHGIPSEQRVLREGDIISLDCGCTYQGYVADSAFTMGVGAIPPVVQRLLDVTEQALYAGIAAARAGQETADIAFAVQAVVERAGYSVAREYTGHGVGRTMHEPPDVPNWWPRNRRQRHFVSEPLRPGMTFAIEPMVIAGRPDLKVLADRWTVVTRDGSLCAHFEHTIAVTEGEALILTQPD
jgi:methionyl aminopeptidase